MDANKQVWVPDSTEGFVRGQIVDIGNDSITVNANGKVLQKSIVYSWR